MIGGLSSLLVLPGMTPAVLREERRVGFMVTYSDFCILGMLIISIISLVVTIYNNNDRDKK